MFGLVFMSHQADCRVSGILVVKRFGVLRDRSLDLEFFMWLVRIQTEQNHKEQISKRDACYDCVSPGQREKERERASLSYAVSFTCRIYYSQSSKRTDILGVSLMFFRPHPEGDYRLDYFVLLSFL